MEGLRERFGGARRRRLGGPEERRAGKQSATTEERWRGGEGP